MQIKIINAAVWLVGASTVTMGIKRTLLITRDRQERREAEKRQRKKMAENEEKSDYNEDDEKRK